jgi:hypothetical protein
MFFQLNSFAAYLQNETQIMHAKTKFQKTAKNMDRGGQVPYISRPTRYWNKRQWLDSHSGRAIPRNMPLQSALTSWWREKSCRTASWTPIVHTVEELM